jgi:hypothetical protein
LAEVRPRSGRDNIDHPAASIQNHDFVIDDKEVVIAEIWNDVDQRREGRHCHDVHMTWHYDARVDREVDAVDVHAWRVPGGEHRLPNRSLLLCAQRRAARLGLGRRAGLALRIRARAILCGSTRGALTLRSGTGAILLLLLGRLSALLPLGRALAGRLALCAGTASILLLCLSRGGFLLPALRPARLIAVALALTYGLILLSLVALGVIPIALVFRPARLIAAAFALSYGLTLRGLVLLGLVLLGLAMLGLTAIHRSIALALGPAAFSHSLSPGFTLHSFVALSARRAPGHFAPRRAAGRHSVFAARARAAAGRAAHAAARPAALHALC